MMRMHVLVMQTLGVLLLVAAIGFQVLVTFRVRNSALFDRAQKSLQTRLIWCVPVLGAALVFSVLSTEERHERSQSNSQTKSAK